MTDRAIYTDAIICGGYHPGDDAPDSRLPGHQDASACLPPPCPDQQCQGSARQRPARTLNLTQRLLVEPDFMILSQDQTPKCPSYI